MGVMSYGLESLSRKPRMSHLWVHYSTGPCMSPFFSQAASTTASEDMELTNSSSATQTFFESARADFTFESDCQLQSICDSCWTNAKVVALRNYCLAVLLPLLLVLSSRARVRVHLLDSGCRPMVGITNWAPHSLDA